MMSLSKEELVLAACLLETTDASLSAEDAMSDVKQIMMNQMCIRDRLKTYWKWNVSWRLRRKLSTQTTSSASRSGTRTSIMRWCRPPTICICMTHGHAFICAAIYTPAFSIGFTHVKHRSNPARWRNIRLFSMHYATMIRNWPFRW